MIIVVRKGGEEKARFNSGSLADDLESALTFVRDTQIRAEGIDIRWLNTAIREGWRVIGIEPDGAEVCPCCGERPPGDKEEA